MGKIKSLFNRFICLTSDMFFPTIWAFCGSCWLPYTSQRLHHGMQ